MALFKLKATKTDRSRSIILSFHSKWYEAVQKGEFSVVFRKMGPIKFVPDLLYAYLTAPVSAIIARAEVTKYEHLPIEDALLLSRQGLLTKDEVRSYGLHYSHLFVFHLGQISISQSPVTMQHLVSNYDFWPSSTFIPLSGAGKETIDRLAGFTN